jgi:hypothetical protein
VIGSLFKNPNGVTKNDALIDRSNGIGAADDGHGFRSNHLTVEEVDNMQFRCTSGSRDLVQLRS